MINNPSNSEQTVQRSSINNDTYETPWLNRDSGTNPGDPWIDLGESPTRSPGDNSVLKFVDYWR